MVTLDLCAAHFWLVPFFGFLAFAILKGDWVCCGRIWGEVETVLTLLSLRQLPLRTIVAEQVKFADSRSFLKERELTLGGWMW